MTADFRLAVPAVSTWLAAGVTIAVPSARLTFALCLWACALVTVIIAIVTRRGRVLPVVALCCLAAALACTVAAASGQARQPESVVVAARSSHFVRAEVVVTSNSSGQRPRFAGTAISIEVGGAATSLSSPVLVFGELPKGAHIGSTIRVAGSLKALAPEESTAFLLFASGTISIEAAPPWYLGWANGLRDGFRDAAAELPGDGGDLLPGLAIGETSAVSASLDAAMKASSLSHLTAVSGANCAVVVGLIIVVGGALGASRAVRSVAALVVLLGFVVLVTPEPSVVRAAVMATIVLIAVLSGRPVRGLPVLSLAVICLLVADPWLSREYGFILSVLATGGLLLLAGPLAVRLARCMPLPIAAVIAVPLAAQLACQPVLILLNASIPLYGVVANVLAEPAAPLATVLGLIACLTLPGLPWLGHAVASLAWLPSSWIASVATFFAAAPGNRIPWLAGPIGVGLLALLTGLALVAVFGGERRRARWVAGAASALIVIVLVGSSLGTRIIQDLNRPPNWQIAVCDIGQGDATLVRSDGLIALIDTGPRPERLTKCLGTLGIDHIDLLVLTHYDLDHVGGASAVVGLVDQALVGPSGGADDDRLDSALARSGATVTAASRGMTGTLGEFRWQILWPESQLHGLEPGNDVSIAMTFLPVGTCIAGCLSSLFLADLGEQPQGLVLAAGPVPRVDVVKVSHHGSADQNARMYEQASAIVGVIGVGADNTYGHPTSRLLNMLAAVGTAALRTDQDGLILLSPGSQPGTVSVWTEK
jgi:competence protein ComEC